MTFYRFFGLLEAISSNDKPVEQPVEGEGKAPIRERQKVKRLEETADEKAREIDRLTSEVDRLKKRNERLKQQLAAARKTPTWANANKPEDDNGKPGKKKWPKKGHEPNIRRCPEQADHEVVFAATSCPCCDESLPMLSRWHQQWANRHPKTGCPDHNKILGWLVLVQKMQQARRSERAIQSYKVGSQSACVSRLKEVWLRPHAWQDSQFACSPI